MTDPAPQPQDLRIHREEQNLGIGIAAGAIAALLGAGAWAAVTAATNFQIGWMAVGVGFLVGYGVRKFGKGVDPVFGFAGAALALFGCLLGNLLAAYAMGSKELGVPVGELVSQIGPVEILKATFSPMDLLFYGIAVYEGYKLSFREA